MTYTLPTVFLFFGCAGLPCGLVQADQVVMQNGQKMEGNVTGMKDGKLEVQVPSGYLAGLAATSAQRIRFAKAQRIVFDGRDDFFAIVKKSDEVIDAQVVELSKSKLKVEGHAPISTSAIKALVPTRPNAAQAP